MVKIITGTIYLYTDEEISRDPGLHEPLLKKMVQNEIEFLLKLYRFRPNRDLYLDVGVDFYKRLELTISQETSLLKIIKASLDLSDLDSHAEKNLNKFFNIFTEYLSNRR